MGKISFNNFKAFGEKPQTFSNKPITLIYGPNSIGKSSLLHALLYHQYAMINPVFSPKETAFAGDEIDFGGFENFIHNHDTSKKIVYNFSYDKEEEISKFIGVNAKEINKYTQNLTKEFIEEKIEKYNKSHVVRFENIVKFYETIEIMKKKDKRRILDGFSYVKMEDYLMSNYSLNLIEIVICIEKYTKIEDRTDKKEKVSLNTLLKKIKIIEYARGVYLYEDIIENGKIEKKSKDNSKKYMDIIQEEYLELQKNDDEFIKFCLKYNIFEINTILKAIEKIKLLSQIEQIGFKLELENTNRFREDEDRNLTVCINHQPWIEINHEKIKVSVEENVLIDKKMIELINERGLSGMHMYNSETDKMLYLKHHYSKNKLNIDILKIEANFSRYFQTRKIQYFAPLRFYPKRKDLVQFKEKDNNKEPKNNEKIGKIKFYWLLIYNYLLHKYINKKDRNIFIGLIIALPKFKSLLLKAPMMIDIFNRISFINIKYKDTSTAKNIWNELIQSKYGIENLNKWLSDDKKLKSQYKIEVLEDEKRKGLVFVDLRNNIEVTPRDMGLGVSQVLPILVASQNFEDTTLFLEQPELHLHPAVQCELTDEFIKSAKENGNKFYIETHSEHLLLRVMKRLRHSSEGKLKEDDPLYLTPEDICLLYVDNDSEKTYIQELRLSNTGRLLDGWPNGFFEEGFKERFL